MMSFTEETFQGETNDDDDDEEMNPPGGSDLDFVRKCVRHTRIKTQELSGGDHQYIIQKPIERPVMLQGRKLEFRVLVVMARRSPLVVLMDPEYVVKWGEAGNFIVNSHAGSMATPPMAEVTWGLCKERHPEFDEQALAASGCAETIMAGVTGQVKSAIVAGFTSILGAEAITGADSDPHEYNSAWEIYGLDFGLTWEGNGHVRSWMFDWNYAPGMGLQRATKLTFIREAYHAIGRMARRPPVPPIDDVNMRLLVVVDAHSNSLNCTES